MDTQIKQLLVQRDYWKNRYEEEIGGVAAGDTLSPREANTGAAKEDQQAAATSAAVLALEDELSSKQEVIDSLKESLSSLSKFRQLSKIYSTGEAAGIKSQEDLMAHIEQDEADIEFEAYITTG